ncbi:MAG TPA: NAD(P)H-dependent oxidoreductase [Jatrophihabitantaceae bacterium]|nr:NAD(P)H-dependent oxidoreductase [Jatrophihabitantaceae bacterium]
MTDGPQDRVLVVGIGGSPGTESVTGRLLRDCLALVEKAGARTELFDGDRLAELPIFTTHGYVPDPTSDALVEAVRRADAVVIATPGYHGAMSGLVKNALDHLESLREDVRPYLDGRAVGAIVCSAGWQACGTALVSVRSAVHALRGWPTPFGVTVNSAEQQADDPRVVGGLQILADQLMQFTDWQRAR